MFELGSFDGEFVDDRVLVNLAGLQDGRREARLIRRVGIMLRLHAEAIAERIRPAAFAGDRVVEEISRVELHAGFGRPHIHHATARRLDHSCGMSQRAD